MTDQSGKELREAIFNVQRSVRGVHKDGTNEHYESSYATLAAVWDAIRVPLEANRLTITHPLFEANGKLYLLTKITHVDTGQTESSAIPILNRKEDMQGLGSAITYAERYGIQSLLGLPSRDDDGEASVIREIEKTKTRSAFQITNAGIEQESPEFLAQKITLDLRKELHQLMRTYKWSEAEFREYLTLAGFNGTEDITNKAFKGIISHISNLTPTAAIELLRGKLATRKSQPIQVEIKTLK